MEAITGTDPVVEKQIKAPYVAPVTGHCHRCAKEVPKKAVFCRRCGAAQPVKQKKTSEWKPLFRFVMILFLLFLAGCMCMIVFKGWFNRPGP
jgi:predicted amidophosphoribosyltransferase